MRDEYADTRLAPALAASLPVSHRSDWLLPVPSHPSAIIVLSGQAISRTAFTVRIISGKISFPLRPPLLPPMMV